MSTRISRDPFSRSALVRRLVADSDGCSECGNKRNGKLFQYGTERDGISRSYIGPHWHKGFSCSKGCHDAYHN